MSKKYAVVSSQCVACGCCEKICPLHAIQVTHGIRASVNVSSCVGCGKCLSACPASVITLKEREAAL